jgi:hypothetical protein
MRRSTSLPVSLARLALGLLVVSGAIGSLAPQRLEAAPPENPFLEIAEDLQLGPTVRTRGAILMALKLPDDVQPGLMAHVGLAQAETRITPLPGPAGRWHVRISNRETFPLLVPAGETILTPMRASRTVDRAVWIPAGGASFVPVIQGVPVPPTGPYLSRGRGLTPMELSVIPSDRWADRVRHRNRLFGVPGTRLDDAAAAFTTELFASVLERYQTDLDALVAPHSVVGVAVCDDRGLHYIHIECDRGRFAAYWPTLRDGIVLDALMLERTGAAPRPGDDAALRATVRVMLRALRDEPMRRPTFGDGWQYRWNVGDPPAYWEGLAIPAGPVSLSLHRDAPRPAAGTGQPTGPPGGTGGPLENQETPGIFEGERKARPSEFEKRLRDRRREGLGRGSGTPPGTTSPGGRTPPPRTGGGRPPSAPPPRIDPPGGGGGGIGPRGR